MAKRRCDSWSGANVIGSDADTQVTKHARVGLASPCKENKENNMTSAPHPDTQDYLHDDLDDCTEDEMEKMKTLEDRKLSNEFNDSKTYQQQEQEDLRKARSPTMAIVEAWVFQQNYVMEQLVSSIDNLTVTKKTLAISGLGLVVAKNNLWDICNYKVRERVRHIVDRWKKQISKEILMIPKAKRHCPFGKLPYKTFQTKTQELHTWMKDNICLTTEDISLVKLAPSNRY